MDTFRDRLQAAQREIDRLEREAFTPPELPVVTAPHWIGWILLLIGLVAVLMFVEPFIYVMVR